jgi:hypothetical protein
VHRTNVAQAQCFAFRGFKSTLECSNVFKVAQVLLGILRNVQGCSARRILEGPGVPKGLIFADSCSGCTVFKKGRFSRIFETNLFLDFLKFNSAVLACSCSGVNVVLGSRTHM